jgi:hypothetical protein
MVAKPMDDPNCSFKRKKEIRLPQLDRVGFSINSNKHRNSWPREIRASAFRQVKAKLDVSTGIINPTAAGTKERFEHSMSASVMIHK